MLNTDLNTGIIGLMAILLFAGCTSSSRKQESERENKRQQKDWALVVHGGAGAISKSMPDSLKQKYRDDLDEALSIGEKVLKEGGSSVDAVEKVINYLEDNPGFNAGKGAVFTHEGGHELDAAIMVGNTAEAGTITGVKTIKNPISLARYVMEHSRHVMFAGEGAEQYANQTDLERVNQDYFYTEPRFKAWKRMLKQENKKAQSQAINNKKPTEQIWHHPALGTVGCVALDKNGQLVAGTSTGGMTNKRFGRVGDVPIIGGGTYASEEVAVSMTGWGEKIMRAVSAHTVSDYITFKDASLEDAGNYLLNEVLKPGEAGMIAIDKQGNTYMNMNTEGMFRGKSDSEGNRSIAIWK